MPLICHEKALFTSRKRTEGAGEAAGEGGIGRMGRMGGLGGGGEGLGEEKIPMPMPPRRSMTNWPGVPGLNTRARLKSKCLE